jgi:hypothetical protein
MIFLRPFHRTSSGLPPPSSGLCCSPLIPPWRWKHRRPVEAGPALPRAKEGSPTTWPGITRTGSALRASEIARCANEFIKTRPNGISRHGIATTGDLKWTQF